MLVEEPSKNLFFSLTLPLQKNKTTIYILAHAPSATGDAPGAETRCSKEFHFVPAPGVDKAAPSVEASKPTLIFCFMFSVGKPFILIFIIRN
jgi:hypothetical protein